MKFWILGLFWVFPWVSGTVLLFNVLALSRPGTGFVTPKILGISETSKKRLIKSIKFGKVGLGYYFPLASADNMKDTK